MSTYSRKPKYQNTFAYKHNPKSRKTLTILSLPNQGVCRKCFELIEWKKKYRKYKPLTGAKKCQECLQKTITQAYHVICAKCAQKDGVCAKCRTKSPTVIDFLTPEQKEQQDLEEEEYIASLKERERRTYLRKKKKGELEKAEEEAKGEKEEADGGEEEEGEGGVKVVETKECVTPTKEEDKEEKTEEEKGEKTEDDKEEKKEEEKKEAEEAT